MSKTKWYARPIYLLIALVLVLSLGIVAAPMAGTAEASPDDWYVDGALGTDGGDPQGTGQGALAFATIQYAINDARVADGDTITVAAGRYEEDIEITKSNLTLKGIGDPPPVIDGGGAVDRVVYVHNATHVTIENFEVTGGTGDLVYGEYADNITIRSVTAHGSTGDEGIQVKHSDNVTIEDCTSYENMGDGICVSYGSGHLIKHNVIYNNDDRGIYLYGDWGGVPLSDARIEDNTVYGSRGTVPGGSDRFKEGGIICYYTQGIEIVGNFIYENIGPGIHLYKMNHGRPEDVTSYVRDNHVHDNTDGDTPGDGIHAYLTYNTIISNNELDNNAGAGVTLTTQYPDDTEYMFEEPNSGVQVLANDIYGNTDGLQVISRLGDHDVRLNNIHTNTVGADASQAAKGVTVDAENNWWGNVNGPSDPSGTKEMPQEPEPAVADMLNAEPVDDLGNGVSNNVDYYPWLEAPYRPTTPMASFTIDHAKIDFKKKADDDKVRVKGTLALGVASDGVDISDDVTVTVGSFCETITMVEKGKKGEKWEYKRPKGDTGEIKHMTINWKNGKFDIRMDKADLTGVTKVTNPVTISIQIGDDFGEETITMRVKKHHWDYKAK